MKQVLLIVLLWIIVDCVSLQNTDFIFPDDNQPNGVPEWALNPARNFPPQDGFSPQSNFPPQPQKFPPNFINEPTLPTVAIADIATITTTPSPNFHICMQNCPVTSEYNPICGSNRALYYNMSKFRCAQRCGADAQIVRRGSCRGLFPMMLGG